MKVCLVHEEYPLTSNFGGIATYQYNLAKALTAIGHEVTVICRTDVQKQYNNGENWSVIPVYIENYNPYNIKKVKEYRKKVASILLKLQEQKKIEIIETPEWGANCIYYLKSIHRKLPVVVKLHTPLFIWKKFNYYELEYNYNQLMENWEKFQIENADGVLACSKNILEEVGKRYSIPKINKVIFNPVTLIDKSKKTQEKSIKNIAFFGSLEERKGIISLAKTIKKYRKNFNNFNFNIYGADTTRNRYGVSTFKIVKKYLLDSGIRFKYFGHIEHEDVIDKMLLQDLIVAPSLYDNLPYVVLEALMAKVPVISSMRGGIPEIISQRKNGLLINPEKEEDYVNAIYYLNSRDIRSRITSEGVKTLEKFNSTNIAKKNSLFYKKVEENFSDR